MRTSRKVAMLFVFLLSLVLVAGGCSSSSSDSPATTTTTTTDTTTTTTSTKGSGVHLTGSVGSGSPVSGFFNMRFAAPVTTAVWAMPIAKIGGANIDSMSFMLRETSTLTSGNFSFDLRKSITVAEIKAKFPGMDFTGYADTAAFDVDWMLVQMAGTTPLNVIQLKSDATYSSLITIPLSAFTSSVLDIGAVNSGAAALTVGGIASSLTLTSSSLVALARADDILGTITDVIRNCDVSDNLCISAEQGFVFMGIHSAISTTENRADSYSGYQLHFQLQDKYSKTDFDGICPGAAGPPTIEYTLTPPQPISLNSATYSVLTTSLTSTGDPSILSNGTDTYTNCFKDNLINLRKNNAAASNDWYLSFGTGDMASNLITDTTAGDWVLSRNTSTGLTGEVGRFEFALAKPVDGAGMPIVFVPAIMIDLDGTGDKGITTLHIKWVQYSGSGYVEVTDAALLNSLMGGFDVYLIDDNGIDSAPGSRWASKNGIDFGTHTIDISDLDGKGKFYYQYTADNTKYKLDYIGVGYRFGGQNFRFAWR